MCILQKCVMARRRESGVRWTRSASLAVATDRLRRRTRTIDPVALRDDLIRLRRIIDRIELEFSTVAGAFRRTPRRRSGRDASSPPHWMRVECGMTSSAATSAIAVGIAGGGSRREHRGGRGREAGVSRISR